MPTSTAIPSSKEGSNRSAGAIAGAIVGSVFALILLAAITLFVRRRLPFYWNGKRMRRLLDEDPPPPQMNDVDRTLTSGPAPPIVVPHLFFHRFSVQQGTILASNVSCASSHTGRTSFTRVHNVEHPDQPDIVWRRTAFEDVPERWDSRQDPREGRSSAS